MDTNQQKEQFSAAYVRAGVAVAGLRVSKLEADDDSIDLTLSARGAVQVRVHASASASVLTIDTMAIPPELADASAVAHSTGWKCRSNFPSVSAGRSSSNSAERG